MGHVQDMVMIFRMPSGFIMAGLCVAGGLFLSVYAGREFSEGNGCWWRKGIVALTMLIAGIVIAVFAL